MDASPEDFCHLQLVLISRDLLISSPVFVDRQMLTSFSDFGKQGESSENKLTHIHTRGRWSPELVTTLRQTLEQQSKGHQPPGTWKEPSQVFGSTATLLWAQKTGSYFLI